MQITVYGFGYVGKAVHAFLKDHFSVGVYDPAYPELSEKPVPSDFAVVCVPTAMREDGSADTSIVEETIKATDHKYYLIKSTVPPGTVDRLIAETGKKICFSPEYIGEGKYFMPYWKYPHPTDMKYHDFFVVGGDPEACAEFVHIFQKVSGPTLRIFKMRAIDAEVVKYTENMWGAMKVTFMNEVYKACQALGADFDTVREGFLADPRTERMHTMVRKEKRGFSGKCYPKDLVAFIRSCENKGHNPELLKAIWNRNIDFVLESGAGAHGDPEWAREDRKL